jgi:hypothetical protein
VIDEWLGEIREVIFASPEERRVYLFCGGIGVCAVIDEELGEISEA